MVINFKRVSDGAIEPSRGSTQSAGLDLYAVAEGDGIMIEPGATAMISTGLCMEIPEGYFGAVYARSGLASKKGLRPANCVGVIDSDYRGEVTVAIHNDSRKARCVRNGDRVAQLVVMPYLNISMNEVSEISKTDRDTGGFGSTGR